MVEAADVDAVAGEIEKVSKETTLWERKLEQRTFIVMSWKPLNIL